MAQFALIPLAIPEKRLSFPRFFGYQGHAVKPPVVAAAGIPAKP
jgi:hypothetical protein